MTPRQRLALIAALAVVFCLCLAPLAFAASTPAQALQYRSHIQREAQFRFGIPAPVPAIAGQITQESGWNPLARSYVGASGLMQFMPQTATWANTAANFGSVDPTNPLWAIRAGVWYDRWLYERSRGATDCDKWMYSLSGYNGGLGYVFKRQKLSPNPGSYVDTIYINPGITPSNQHENETYGPKILLKHQLMFTQWGRLVCLP